uniref:Peptidyl-prolyl cis-trans isomerase n=1 Tax=uncultured Thiotrichaceae bacterium TaxID=298394 RepID=A0A6S6SNX6_9GAMM|nr:MAG: Peptidyl-prolyl cis-trans isomerase PpiB (EC [uncultured Thiotrichaceae bacterium]
MKQALALMLILAFGTAGCGAAETTTNSGSATQQETTKTETTEATQKNTPSEKKTSSGDIMSNPKVLIETSKGNITIELDAENAPISTKNFIAYVEDGFYEGTIFHRVIPNFMVQGGGMNPDMSEKANKGKIQNEANNGLKNERGTLAMARTPDPHSASSQFFVNVADNSFLNFKSETPQGWGYAVFGKVTDGMDIVDAIVGVKTGNRGGHQDVPAEPITMDKVTVVE